MTSREVQPVRTQLGHTYLSVFFMADEFTGIHTRFETKYPLFFLFLLVLFGWDESYGSNDGRVEFFEAFLNDWHGIVYTASFPCLLSCPVADGGVS